MNQYWKDRGSPWEYDPGPPTTSSSAWLSLFAGTPNYRGLGQAVLKKESFRWHHGPMFYRGRLDGSAKVLIIGQEGAQDEALAHRSFIGGTGARMQHVLNHLGITHSYLFLNTFVYPIFGQYTTSLKGLAQDRHSPVAQHRASLFDEVLANNDLRLVITVGEAAKESVVTWITSRGGTCPDGPADVSTFTPANALGPRTHAVGVLHPGGATKGGSVTAIIAAFKKALHQIEQWAADDPTWLPPDPDGTRLPPDSYKYSSDPVPFRDLPFGLSWRIGSGATSSNRTDNQRSIQLFSAGGHYSGKGDTIHYATNAAGTKDGYADETGDLPYEPPRHTPKAFDPGPGTTFAALLQGGATGLAWPDFNALGVTAHPSLGTGPIYRGRLQGASILVLADQESSDDLFSGRAMTGDGGQHFQAFLAAAGLTSKYAILRTLPVEASDLSSTTLQAILDDAQLRKVYAAIVAKVVTASPALGAVVAVGPGAAHLAPHVRPATLAAPTIAMKTWNTSGWQADWQHALSQLNTLAFPRDGAKAASYDGSRGEIPRADLPFGMLRWQGTSGSRGERATEGGQPSPDYFKLFMPTWAFGLAPAPLSPSEAASVPLIPH